MPRDKLSPFERRKAEVAGGVVLQVLRVLPDSASAQMFRELLDMAIVDPEDRALFDFLGGGDLEDGAAPVTSPRSPVLSGGAAVDVYAPPFVASVRSLHR